MHSDMKHGGEKKIERDLKHGLQVAIDVIQISRRQLVLGRVEKPIKGTTEKKAGMWATQSAPPKDDFVFSNNRNT